MSATNRLAQLTKHINAPQLGGPLLNGQVAIITGAGQGIGFAASLLFAQHGAKVVVADLDGAKADEAARLIKEAGGEAIGVQGNVMDPAFGEKLVKATVDKYGKINHIINNAGFTNDRMLHTTDDALFQQMLECHTVAPFRILRAAAPYMRIKDQDKQENRSVVFVSSTSGTHGNVGQANYSAAKSALIGLTKTVAKEWGPFGVRSNCVAFGWIQTRLTAAKEAGATIEIDGKKVALGIPGRGNQSGAVNASADIPLRRPGEPAEAAGSLLFLASPLASYVSGQILEVTGGRGI